MLAKKILSVLALSLLAACSGGGNSSGPTCSDRDACINDAKCQCWCSMKCGYRKKTAADRPVYIDNDPNGKGCYCKQWDLDNYDERCVNKPMMGESMYPGQSESQMQQEQQYQQNEMYQSYPSSPSSSGSSSSSGY